MDFEPIGLVFLLPAELKITLGDDLLDIPLSQLEAYHRFADGTTVTAEILSIRDGDGTTEIRIKAPSFSRYGLRNSSQ
jgi:hypothetical protein